MPLGKFFMYHYIIANYHACTDVLSTNNFHWFDIIRWLTFQACPLRGHDESSDSINQGNFLELVKLLASYNKDVNAVVLENAPENSKYTSLEVHIELLSIYARKVQQSIREEIGNSKFCIMVDEDRDESEKEQMAIILRFVNKEGYIKERLTLFMLVTLLH
jgi:hypothetical protein